MKRYHKKHQLNNEETLSIERKLQLELMDKHYRTTKRAAIASLPAAFVGLWIFYSVTSVEIVISWTIAVLFVHVYMIILSVFYEKSKRKSGNISMWLQRIRVAIAISSFSWGCMGVLFITGDIQNQVVILYCLTLLAATLAFGTTNDLMSAIVGLTGMLVPFIICQFYLAITLNPATHIEFGITFIFYYGMLIAMSYVAHGLSRKALRLAYTNQALKEKLKLANDDLSMVNNELDQRVQQRTRELKTANTKLEYRATHDELTGLINHDDLINEAISTLIDFSKSNQVRFSVIYFSINNLQEITINHGAKYDNTAVKAMSARLSKNLSDRYQIFITRRDTFVLLLYQFSDAELIHEITHIKEILDSPFQFESSISDDPIRLRSSIGIAVYPDHGTNAEELKLNADLSMSYAKQVSPEQTHHMICSKDTSEQIRLESRLKREIVSAIARDEFFLAYQVIVDMQTGRPNGAEVLIRWQHPSMGLVPPGNFIDLAERSGEIIPLGRWILHQACAQARRIHQSGFPGIKISVNLSARQLESDSIIQDIELALYDADLSPEYLELELTETVKFGPQSLAVLREIDSLGISLSIDDFGQGQSGLNMLKEFDFIKKIKLDRAFIKDLPADERSKEIVINSLSLARSLSSDQRKITVLAEGIDKIEQLKFLRKIGVDMAQGFLFSKPIPLNSFINFLRENPDEISESHR